MFLYPVPAPLIPFPKTSIICVAAFLMLFQDITFINKEATNCINEEAIGAINEAAIGAIIALQHPPSRIFISCFTVLVISSINKVESSSDLTSLIISSIS